MWFGQDTLFHYISVLTINHLQAIYRATSHQVCPIAGVKLVLFGGMFTKKHCEYSWRWKNAHVLSVLQEHL